MWPRRSEGVELGLGYEGSTWPLNWPKLGHRNAVAGDKEGHSGGHLVDHPSVVVAQLSLRNGLRHKISVALGATLRYTFPATLRRSFRSSSEFEYECLQSAAGICQTLWHTDVVRTTLDLDDALVASLMARLPGVSKTEAIQRAVRFYLTHDAVDQLRQLAGTVEIDDVSGALRGTDRTT